MIGADEKYKQTIRELSDRLVEVQRPIRILDSVKWDADVEQGFFLDKGRELPAVDRAYYEARPLPFDPDGKCRELEELELAIHRRLGEFNPIGSIMRRMCEEYEVVIEMLVARGTRDFSRKSKELYGSAHDVFHAGEPTLADLGGLISTALESIGTRTIVRNNEKTYSAEQTVELLQERLDRAFPRPDRPMRVRLSDGIVSDAAAGADYIKLRKDSRFTERDLRLLEIHEGWVHLGTTFNGAEQPVCTFLSKGPPSSTVTQEGLAIFMELLAFASYPARVRKLTNRIRAVAMAEEGADFLQVYRFFRDQGFDEAESYQNTTRVFRGSTPDGGGPFTKDLSYSRGFVRVYNFIGVAVRKGRLDVLPFLFCGKTTLEDIRTLRGAAEEGIVETPKYLPPQFADIEALTAWMCYSNFLSGLDLKRVESDYANII